MLCIGVYFHTTYMQVLLYNGQLDIIVGAPLTENYLQQLKWSGQEDYLNADKTVWKINSVTVGYVKQVGRFQQVILVHKYRVL